MNSSPKFLLAGDSSRIQLELSNKIFSNSTFESIHKPSGLTSVAEKSSQMINRRLKNHRHPLSGMRALVPDMLEHFTSSPDFFSEDNKSAHRLNSRILETWINNTIADASALNIPGQVVKEDSRLPLMRFGIDRTSLLKSGLQAQEVDRLYRSLFVYSIGFYQLIQKILEHTNKKYTIVTGVWKVYAILLEYCCQLDYQMIITTLNLEKREEIEQLESDFQSQINKMELHEKELEENITNVRLQLEEVQKDLHNEIYKREEIEDELMRRGNGHEEEVTMRLQFESKLNQMYAKMRDLQTKIELLNENLQEIQKESHLRAEQLQKERIKSTQLIKVKTETEQEMKRVEEISKQTENLNTNLDKKLTETYSTIETLSISLSNLNAKYNETINELAQKKIEVDDLRFSIEILANKLLKLEATAEEREKEKVFHIKRIGELETTLLGEVSSNTHYKQEYFRIKEIDSVNSADLAKFKSRCSELDDNIDQVTKQRDSAIIQLEGKTTLCEELKLNLKDLQGKLEEMNKGRRSVEEQNKSLKIRVDELLKDVTESKIHNKNLKDEIERFKANQSDLEFEINDLKIKLQSVQKQYQTTKETLGEKVSNLNEILESEKKIRENWIYRFEDEQKNHANVTRELIQTHDKLNEMTIKVSHLEAALEESNFQRSKLTESHKEDLQEILVLRFSNEDFIRKNKTLQLLVENIDHEFKIRQDEAQREVERILQDNNEKINTAFMTREETWARAAKNYQETLESKKECIKAAQNLKASEIKVEDLKKESEKKSESIEGKALLLEDGRSAILSLHSQAEVLKTKLKKSENQFAKSQKALQDFRNLAPPDVRNAPNPFRILANQIQDLKNTLENIENSKPVLKDFEMQWNDPGPEKEEKEIQTDLVKEEKSRHFNEAVSRGGQTPISRSEILRSSSSKSKNSANRSIVDSYRSSQIESVQFAELKLAKKSSRVKDLDTEEMEEEDKLGDSLLHHDDERITPLNMKSIYSKEIKESREKELKESKDLIGSVKTPNKLPMINPMKKTPLPSPVIHSPSPIPTLPSADFKRALKQAVSRKKNNE
jgi:hypothetical protein